MQTAKIANQDDDTTPNVDESAWLNGASEQAEVAKVARPNEG